MMPTSILDYTILAMKIFGSGLMVQFYHQLQFFGIIDTQPNQLQLIALMEKLAMKAQLESKLIDDLGSILEVAPNLNEIIFVKLNQFNFIKVDPLYSYAHLRFKKI